MALGVRVGGAVGAVSGDCGACGFQGHGHLGREASPIMPAWPGAGWVSEGPLQYSPSDYFLPGQQERVDCVQSEGWVPPGWFIQ